ncbi:MAG: hypothetical protein JWN70_2882 [Planctomycetaceae bacterium]|nr:hypothetical protein [Planctomycetaceae bacterium]
MDLIAFIRRLLPWNWCSRKVRTFVLHEVTNADGLNRLILNAAELPLPIPQSRTKGFEFHSVVWQTMTPSGWKQRVAISNMEFQRGAAHRRWISHVHSVQPETGYAIIQVAEQGDLENGWIRFTYTWREWDLVNNVEIRAIKICDERSWEFEDPPGT